MRNQILALTGLLVLGLSASADTVTIKCSANSQVTESQFEATAVLTIDENHKVTGDVTYATQDNLKAPFVSGGTIQVTGQENIIPAGEMYANEVDSFQLTNGASPFVTFSMNAGAKGAFSSRMLFHSTSYYISECEAQ